MIRKLLLFCLVCSLLLLHSHSEASQLKYDLFFKRWGLYYFPFESWQWFKSQGIAESNLNPNAVSWAGAMGVMQLMPATAKGLGVGNPYDAEASIQGGVKYDRWLDKKLSRISNPERRNFMFASYNAGLGNILKAKKLAQTDIWQDSADKLPQVTGQHSKETTGYVQRITRIFRSVGGQG